jgi:hypothetical protein
MNLLSPADTPLRKVEDSNQNNLLNYCVAP